MVNETKKALRMLRYWMRRANELGVNVNALTQEEEKENGKENFPPHPLYREKGKGKAEELSRSPACSPALLRSLADLFDRFWTAYPACGSRKRDRQKCREKFLRLFRGESDPAPLFDAIMRGLDGWKRSRDWSEGYVCAPLVWLNNRRWEVEIADSAPTPADPRAAAFLRERREADERTRRTNAIALEIAREAQARENGGAR